jgi:iron complex transport system substrate-binding protein
MRLLPLVGALALVACHQPNLPQPLAFPSQAIVSPLERNLGDQCVSNFQPGVDYFPNKVDFQYSNQLEVSYHSHYKRLSFRPTVGTDEVLQYVLVQCGTPTPKDVPGVVIQIPVASMVTSNLSMVAAAAELQVADRITGVDWLKSVTHPQLKPRVDAGKVLEVGAGVHASVERIIAMKPSVYFTFYSSYAEYNMHPKLWDLGVVAMAQADHLETTPLGIAEWVKQLALLTNQEARAERVFQAAETEYLRLKQIAQAQPSQPRVLSGHAASRAVWEMFGGQNARAQLIEDAGGRFFYRHNELQSSWLNEEFERVYAEGFDADIWLGGPQGLSRKSELTERNALNGWFAAQRLGRVYVWDKGYAGFWARPYADQSMTKPHWILEDAIRAIHPTALPPGEFHFLKELP